MGKVIEAVYEKGVFKPLEKVDLDEGVTVEIVVRRKASRGLSKLLEKYIVKSDVDLTKGLIEERR
ncbi:antitoxin family protein [Archaeoglobus neptunius]|uniref:antitoxin family protein n=1 Tax=Archaeoglobus neptunius TaxID=2798580 RepID=UPI001928D739|nr:antitoxin family protein [Archaeoglobus neptunius]